MRKNINQIILAIDYINLFTKIKMIKMFTRRSIDFSGQRHHITNFSENATLSGALPYRVSLLYFYERYHCKGKSKK